MNAIPPMFNNQRETVGFLLANPRTLVTSDPGTGKTRSVLEAHTRRQHEGRLLVLAPLTVLESAWEADIDKFAPFLTSAMALAGKRQEAFDSGADVVLMNHDGVKWLDENLSPYKGIGEFLKDFSTLCVDEFTAFKNHSSQRSKALAEVVGGRDFPNRVFMSGTPNANDITDIWHPMLCLDDGERLGDSFIGFRDVMCTAKFNPHAGVAGASWEPKPGAEQDLALLLADINVRHRIEDCLDLPPQSVRWVKAPLSRKSMRLYKELAAEALLMVGDETVSAQHAGAKAMKLLQAAAGLVYSDTGKSATLETKRLDLAVDMVRDAPHPSLVMYQWDMQEKHLSLQLDAYKVTHATISGKVSQPVRAQAVRDMQEGRLKCILMQPAAAAHGLTLTAAKTVIWASPTYRSELYVQANARVRRPGQNANTEVIHMHAPGTVEHHVYNLLGKKVMRITDLLALLSNLT